MGLSVIEPDCHPEPCAELVSVLVQDLVTRDAEINST
jgi:hypothetical protein